MPTYAEGAAKPISANLRARDDLAADTLVQGGCRGLCAIRAGEVSAALARLVWQLWRVDADEADASLADLDRVAVCHGGGASVRLGLDHPGPHAGCANGNAEGESEDGNDVSHAHIRFDVSRIAIKRLNDA